MEVFIISVIQINKRTIVIVVMFGNVLSFVENQHNPAFHCTFILFHVLLFAFQPKKIRL